MKKQPLLWEWRVVQNALLAGGWFLVCISGLNRPTALGSKSGLYRVDILGSKLGLSLLPKKKLHTGSTLSPQLTHSLTHSRTIFLCVNPILSYPCISTMTELQAVVNVVQFCAGLAVHYVVASLFLLLNTASFVLGHYQRHFGAKELVDKKKVSE
jgi:hypothetical protein